MKKITKRILAIVLVLSPLVGFGASAAVFAFEDQPVDMDNNVIRIGSEVIRFTDNNTDYQATVVFNMCEDLMFLVEVSCGNSVVERYVAYCSRDENNVLRLNHCIRLSRFRGNLDLCVFRVINDEEVFLDNNFSVTYLNRHPALELN